MGLGEADTRAKLIDPALHARGWTEDLIRREETAGAVEIVEGRPRRRARGRVDYTLRVKVSADAQGVAVALIEAKAEDLPPTHGLEQAKVYAACKRLNVRFVYACNGHRFVEFDRSTGLTSPPRPLADFPTPPELRARYEGAVGFSLESEPARPLVTRYSGGEEGTRRYYQDAAVRAVLEKLARGEKRALLSLATGAGKTRIAVNLLKRIADAGQLRRALFVCDRDELRSQGLGAFQNVFGADAASVSTGNPQKNARVLVATYQTLEVDRDDGTGSFLAAHYPENYFSHIVIDECHRSAWGKWSQVLTRNPDAVQIGLTATPRQLDMSAATPEAEADRRLNADNLRHFGDPAYEYDMGQGMDDGYLAACEIVQRDIFLDDKTESERVTGVGRADLEGKELVDARTGQPVGWSEVPRQHYDASRLEDRLLMPDRVAAMSRDLFDHLLATGGPEQKTIVFCARDHHADAVAGALNNLYAAWCREQGRPRLEPYAFKCTAASGGVGRGTRLDPPTGKLMFRVYDYTDATRLFGGRFISRVPPVRAPTVKPPEPVGPDPAPERVIEVEGFDVRITLAGRYIVTMVDGQARPVTVEEYKQRLAERLVAEAPTLEAFRARWIVQADRKEMLGRLPDAGRSPLLIRAVEDMADYDLYDVLAELGYGLAPRTRPGRAEAFGYKHQRWLAGLPASAAATLQALTGQFARAGTEGLESPEVFQTPDVMRAGGLAALKALGRPADILRETKERLFAA